MSTILRVVRSVFGTLGSVWPTGAVRLARVLFMRPRRFDPRDHERRLDAVADKKTLDAGLVVWRFGASSSKHVLFMHGWEGRATQVEPMLDVLLELGFEVHALDAPAHGLSQGKEANPIVFADAIKRVDEELGPYSVVIGHSMGGAALTIALADGMHADRAFLLGTPSSLEGVLGRYTDFIGLPESLRPRFFDHVADYVRRPIEESEARSLAGRIQDTEAVIFHAPDDREVPFDDARQLAEAWPGAELVEVPGAGHRRILAAPVVMEVLRETLTKDANKGEERTVRQASR